MNNSVLLLLIDFDEFCQSFEPTPQNQAFEPGAVQHTANHS
jgi:hypothetical protein